jgi:hypothetical protein
MTPDDPAPDPSPPGFADWSEDGAFRAAFLELFAGEERSVLRRAGAILAGQAISGDTHDEPVVISHLAAAAEEARMLAVYLREIHEKAVDRLPTERAERLAARAKSWAGEAAALAEAIERALTTNEEEI